MEPAELHDRLQAVIDDALDDGTHPAHVRNALEWKLNEIDEQYDTIVEIYEAFREDDAGATPERGQR